MDILILGNGFDLAHELDTRYTDFLDYCQKNDIVGNVWLKHFILSKQNLGNKWIDLEDEIYQVIKNIDENIKKATNNYKNPLFPKAYCFHNNYINQDSDLRKILLQLQNYSRSPKTDDKEYVSFDGRSKNYSYYFFATHKGFVNFLYDQLREVTEIFDKYLTDEVLPKIGKKNFEFSLANRNYIRVLNFNYTNTYEKLYHLHNINAEANPKYVYVHGKICNSDECNLILGTHSFYNHLPNDLAEEVHVEFNIFKKHNQRHRYGTIEAYQGLLRELNDKKRIIKPIFYVIGHSLDKADHNILKHIFKAKEDSIINVYYHNQEALDRLITNITEIMGEEETMTKVRFIKQDDPKRGILIPKKEEQFAKA